MRNAELLQTVIQRHFSDESQCADRPGDVPPDARFWVIPGKSGQPRWLLPYDPAMGLPGLQYWAPYDFSSRLKWGAVKLAYRLGGLAHLPGVQLIGVQKRDDLTCLKDWDAYGPMSPVIYISEPSPRCKAVTFLVERKTRRCLAVAKFPIGELSSAKILHETSALLNLSQEGRVSAPLILHQNETMGVSLQEVLSVRNTPRALTIEHIRWLSGLRRQGNTSLAQHAQRLKERFLKTDLPDGVDSQLLDTWLSPIQDGTELPTVWLHGDFAPWNFKQLLDGRYMAIDWEEANRDGLPFYDLAHYLFIQSYLANEALSLEAVLSMPLVEAYCREFCLSRRQAQSIFRFLLLDFWCKRLEEGEVVQADRVLRYIRPLLEGSP